MASFGEQLSAARKQRGLTQEQLADLMNMTRQGISHWETGRTLPDAETLKHLSQVLDYNFEAEYESQDEAATVQDETNAAQQTNVPDDVVRPKKRNWVHLLSFLAGMLAGVLLMLAFPRAEKENLPPPQAELVVRPQEEVYRLLSENEFGGGRGWYITFEIENTTDVVFEPENMVFEFMDGETLSSRMAFSHEELTPYMIGDTLRREDGPMMITVGASDRQLDTVVCTVKGTDENGSSLTFTGETKLSREMAEESTEESAEEPTAEPAA